MLRATISRWFLNPDKLRDRGHRKRKSLYMYLLGHFFLIFKQESHTFIQHGLHEFGNQRHSGSLMWLNLARMARWSVRGLGFGKRLLARSHGCRPGWPGQNCRRLMSGEGREMPNTAPKGKSRERKISGHDYTQKCKPSQTTPKQNKGQKTKRQRIFSTHMTDKKWAYSNINVLQINRKKLISQ